MLGAKGKMGLKWMLADSMIVRSLVELACHSDKQSHRCRRLCIDCGVHRSLDDRSYKRRIIVSRNVMRLRICDSYDGEFWAFPAQIQLKMMISKMEKSGFKCSEI